MLDAGDGGVDGPNLGRARPARIRVTCRYNVDRCWPDGDVYADRYAGSSDWLD